MCFTDSIVYLLMFTYYSVSIVTTQATCQAGWFGTRCQFQCAPACDVTTGQCLEGSKCQLGWFGTACQYQDLANVNSAAITANVDLSSPNWITDRDDSTCNGDVNLESVVVTWNDTTPFTWLRFAVNFSSGLENLTVTFKTSAKEMIEMPCNNQQIFLVDNHTMDMRCNVTVDVMQVIIRGQSVKSLCSLYISGGRNVALKQSASLTSTYTTETSFTTQASNAIDGNTYGSIYYNTCSHTAVDDPSPSWNVKFDRPQAVIRFILYNRVEDDCGVGLPCSDRLKHFILQSVDSNNDTILNYQDTTAIALSEYTVKLPGHLRDLPVSGVQITATAIVIIYKNPTLAICEFEAYGECAPGTWGLECNNQCNSSCNTTCHAETGACQFCTGFSNPECDAPCKPGTWGLGCAQECSSSCFGKFCDQITGVCDKGCNNDSGVSKCTPETNVDTIAIGVGVGVSVGCLLIVSILVAIYCWKRRERPAAQTAATRPHQTQNIKKLNDVSTVGDYHEYETVGPMGGIEEAGTNTGNKYDYIDIELMSQSPEEGNSKGWTPTLEHSLNGNINENGGYVNVDINKIMV